MQCTEALAQLREIVVVFSAEGHFRFLLHPWPYIMLPFSSLARTVFHFSVVMCYVVMCRCMKLLQGIHITFTSAHWVPHLRPSVHTQHSLLLWKGHHLSSVQLRSKECVAPGKGKGAVYFGDFPTGAEGWRSRHAGHFPDSRTAQVLQLHELNGRFCCRWWFEGVGRILSFLLNYFSKFRVAVQSNSDPSRLGRMHQAQC